MSKSNSTSPPVLVQLLIRHAPERVHCRVRAKMRIFRAIESGIRAK